MNAEEQHVITVKPTRFQNYAKCTCIDPITGELWRSPETGSPDVARLDGERHVRQVTR